MINKLNIKLIYDNDNLIIRLVSDNSPRYREWIVPVVVYSDIIRWYKINKDHVNLIEETNICKFNLRPNYLDIKRKDIYSTIGYSLPKMVLDYLIKK